MLAQGGTAGKRGAGNRTVQSRQLRSSLLGPLEAGGGEAWAGPRCWSPDREMAFLQTRDRPKAVRRQPRLHASHGTRLAPPPHFPRRSGFLACWPVNYSWRETAFQLEVCGGGEREQLGGEAPAALGDGDGDASARSPHDSARPVFLPLPFSLICISLNGWTSSRRPTSSASAGDASRHQTAAKIKLKPDSPVADATVKLAR